MAVAISITKRVRKRVLSSGAVVVQPRFVLSFREPRRGKRRQLFVKSHKEAIAKRDALIAALATRTYSDSRHDLTVAHAIENWLDNREGEVKAGTLKTYRQVSRNCIIGPLLIGTPAERKTCTETGKKGEGCRLEEMLGPVRVVDLTTADIRGWHRRLQSQVGSRSANMAKTFLGAALALAAEDFGLRPPPMPTKLGRGKPRPRRALLTLAQIGLLLRAAQEDKLRGVYYAWPFLTGTRPSEQLGVLWDDFDFARNVVHIRRMQERTGELAETTKTASGVREIPLSPLLRAMLIEWQSRCPRRKGQPHRVFPGPQGGALSYWNWRSRYFKPALLALGLPCVTPHSARHGFISALQAKGIEVGLVAKLAGHANAAVTLSHYTQAVRGPIHVFTFRGRPIRTMLNTGWRDAREAAKLPHVRVHDLKHTLGRRLRAAGVSFEDRQDLLGHRSGRITTHYSAAELARLIEAAERVCERNGSRPELVILRGSLHGDSRKTPASALARASALS